MARVNLSSLVGKTDVEDEPTPKPTPRTEPVEPSASTSPRRRSSTTTAPKASGGSKYPPKVSFYQDREDTDRVRGAILHTMASEGSRSLSQFIHKAVMAEVERLESKYNDGQPFPAVGARELPQGRPMGE